ncbi:hypothetical protein [Halosimplex salinum]|uniref:hypothetical protein n=1 Tax=Halosimplex salinum TaxID=1710538 RepID=UPI000F4A85F4|nr:hypothetical protein [Halosimplex salinum]
MTERTQATRPRFEPTTDPPGVRIVDPIEAVDFNVETDRPVDPTVADTGGFRFPVDAAVEFEASVIEFPHLALYAIRDGDGAHVGELQWGETKRLPAGRYSFELSKAPMKLHVEVGGELTADVSDERSVLRAAEPVMFRLGARSYHDQPTGTITTTTAPSDVATAVSQFGSALKTRSPERSWPTLRGCPPLVEVGDELHVPDGIEPPDTGVTIEVPSRLDTLYSVAPLAYYLGATVDVGGPPRLCVGGREWSLTRDGDIATTAANVLKRNFTLDCLVRTEGLYDLELYERERAVDNLPFAPGDVYDRSLPSRVATYMDVPRAVFEEAIPRWTLTADVVPEPDHVGALPYLVRELAVVRCPAPSEFDDPSGRTPGRAHPERVHSTTEPQPAMLSRSAREEWDQEFVYPPPTESVEHAYLGDGVPVGASRLSVPAYERQLRREPTVDVETSVTVVDNDARMSEGDAVADVYALGELESFDVTVLEGASCERLKDALTAETDLLHYVGHVDDRGFQCVDGFLDARTVESVGVRAFLLNACVSFEQGRALVENGAVSGIVTVHDVFDSMAGRLGETAARLLGQGFSLTAALELCKRTTDFPTDEYVVVGDGSVQLTKNETGVAFGLHVTWNDGPTVTPLAYPTTDTPLGTTLLPHAVDNAMSFLSPGEGFPIATTLDSLVESLASEPFPVLHGGDLYWSSDLTRRDVERWAETAEREG